MFLSIIVPVYNAEKYIAECLDSLLDQNIPKNEYEIICVNDGSKDGSRVLIEEYAGRFDNIVLIDRENGGVSSARNAGMAAARGDYIGFVDSDDFIESNVLAQIKELAYKNNTDIVAFPEVFEFNDKLSERERALKDEHMLQANTKYTGGVVWAGVISAKFLNDAGLRFDEDICYGEDQLFMYELSRFNPVKCTYGGLVYYYRRNAVSATRSSSTESLVKRITSGIKGAKTMLRYYNSERQSDHVDSVTANIVMFFLRPAMLALLGLSRRERKKYLKIMKKESLFPFGIPKECTTSSSRMTSRTDAVGRIYDKLCLLCTTVPGYVSLRLFGFFAGIKHRLTKFKW